MDSCSEAAQDVGALGKIHFTEGKVSGKNRSRLSWDSKISEEKVLAEEPRPCRKIMVWVWVWVVDGGMVCSRSVGVMMLIISHAVYLSLVVLKSKLRNAFVEHARVLVSRVFGSHQKAESNTSTFSPASVPVLTTEVVLAI